MDTAAVKLFSLVVLIGCWQASGQDVIVGFSNVEYEGLEENPNRPCRVAVDVNASREIPLQIRLTPTPGNATMNDFNDTEIIATIPPRTTRWEQGIQIFDDNINEAEEVFNVLLTVEGNLTVEYLIRTAVCRIPESDPIEIGFTVPRINHTEQFAQYDTIINKSLVSEQTFDVQIQIVTPTSHIGQRAIQGEDFTIGAVNGIVIQRLTPREQVIHFAYQIIGDNTPENQEVFQLSVTPVINTPSFGCNITSGCYQQIEIVIEDDDVVVVGFVDTLVEVNETDGQATLNVSISSPQPDPALRFEIMFSLNVDSVDGSAGSDFALARRQPHIPGVDDFPQISDGFYYVFDEMAENRSQKFMVLSEMFNGTNRWQTFTFPIYMDDVPEGVEELNLTLSLVLDPTLPAGSVNVTPAVATVRILDFSSVVVGFDSSIYTVSEGDGQAELCVNITVPRRQDIGTVTFNLTVETQNGSADSTNDYMAVSMTLDTFTNQTPRQCFNVSITNDATFEETENFTARLMLMPDSVKTISVDRIIVDPPEATVQITDNDRTITVGYIQTAVNVSEGVQVVQLTVAISMSPGETIETFFLRVNTSDRTATAPGDYGPLTNFRLGPFNNTVRQLSFNVTIGNDSILEDAEMFNVSLTLDPADQARLENQVIVSPHVATVTIQDNDVITVGYVQTVVTVLESDGVAQLTVGISMPPGADPVESFFFMNVNTSDGTATAPGDYGPLTNFRLGPFNNTVRQLSFDVTIGNDSIPENAEMFSASLTLDPADQARLENRVTVSPHVATVTIQDNDVITVGYVQTVVTVLESDGVAQLTVAISMPPGADRIETLFFMIVNTSDGTATAPVDYDPITNFRLGPFNNNVRQLSFNVTIGNDSIPEDAEMFNVSLTLDPADQARFGNRVTVSPHVATVTILDNDVVTVGYVQTVVTVLESDGVAQLTVAISMPPGADPIETSFFLLVNTSDGTATDSGDYVPLTNFRLGPFNNTVHQVSFNVTIGNDSIPEDAEMFNVSLTLDPADQARFGNRVTVSPHVATVTIQDNDVITVGYVQTVVTVLESDGVAQLTVGISMPPGADRIETSFFLLVNTSDGTATAPDDYGALTNFRLGQLNNDVRQLFFNVTIVNDNITEEAEMLIARLTLDPADQARLENLVSVSPHVATITIQDDDVPTGPPLNLVVRSATSTSLTLSWESPSPVHQNGAILNYTLTCVPGSGLPPLVSVFTTAGTHTLNGLTPATSYACSVLAANLYGNSPPANVSAMTEDGVPGPVTEITFQMVSDSEIIVRWRVPEITNGLILNYNITVTQYSSGEVVYTNVVAAGGQLSDRVTGLAPFIPYRVAISAQNNNPGEVNTAIAFSREGTPTAPPRNVQTIRLNGTHMNISWELPTLVEARGFINSTTITLMPNSESKRKKRQTMTVSVPGIATSAVIGGLNPELQYSVVVTTRTSVGNGPETSTVVPAPCIRLFQLLLGEVNDCTEWRFQSTAEKLADITSSIISAANSRCRCSLTVDHISTEHFLCTSDEQVVLYRAELSGRPDCAQVFSFIQQWVNGSQTAILVQGNSLEVYPNCPIRVQSLTAQADCVRSTTPGPDSGSIGIIAAGGGVGGVLLIGVIILAAVVTCMCIYRRKKQRNIDITSNTYSEILFHGTHRKLSESYKMSAVNPLTKPPLPRRTSTTSRPRVDDSYIVMNPVSVKKEISDGLYAEVGTEKETTYENMGECQVPSMPSEYIEPKSQHTPNNT